MKYYSWTLEEHKLFESGDWGDKILADCDGEHGWGYEFSQFEIKDEMFTDAADLIKKVKDDVISGDFSYEDILDKYTVHGAYKPPGTEVVEPELEEPEVEEPEVEEAEVEEPELKSE